MENISPTLQTSTQLIQRYGDGSFLISEKQYSGSVLVFPDRTEVWGITDPDDITLESLAAFMTDPQETEILLIGTGHHMTMLHPDVRTRLREKNVGVDAMDTGAACRTFNVLAAEERRVAAALLCV